MMSVFKTFIFFIFFILVIIQLTQNFQFTVSTLTKSSKFAYNEYFPSSIEPQPWNPALLIPAYFYPSGTSPNFCDEKNNPKLNIGYWSCLAEAVKISPAMYRGGVIIVNPNSGPGTSVDTQYQKAIKAIRDAETEVKNKINSVFQKSPPGNKVPSFFNNNSRSKFLLTGNSKQQELDNVKVFLIGYVSTNYGNRNYQAILDDISKYRNFYGNELDGFFLDETPTSSSKLSFYQNLSAEIRKNSSSSFIVNNPGTFPDSEEKYMDTANITVIHEYYWDTRDQFSNKADWLKNYRKDQFATLYHSVNNVETMRNVTKIVHENSLSGNCLSTTTNNNNNKMFSPRLCLSRYTYLTDDRLNNPWNELPSFFYSLLSSLTTTPTNFGDLNSNISESFLSENKRNPYVNYQNFLVSGSNFSRDNIFVPASLVTAFVAVDWLISSNITNIYQSTSNPYLNLFGPFNSSAKTQCATAQSLTYRETFGYDKNYFYRWMNSTSPYAGKQYHSYYDSIVKQDLWLRIFSIEDAQPGDLIVMKYSPILSSGATGHVMKIINVTKLSSTTTEQEKSPIVNNTIQYEIWIIDSSASYHGPKDTRKLFQQHDSQGIGIGVTRLYGNKSGIFNPPREFNIFNSWNSSVPVVDSALEGYTWSLYSNSEYFNNSEDSSRKVVIGRPLLNYFWLDPTPETSTSTLPPTPTTTATTIITSSAPTTSTSSAATTSTLVPSTTTVVTQSTSSTTSASTNNNNNTSTTLSSSISPPPSLTSSTTTSFPSSTTTMTTTSGNTSQTASSTTTAEPTTTSSSSSSSSTATTLLSTSTSTEPTTTALTTSETATSTTFETTTQATTQATSTSTSSTTDIPSTTTTTMTSSSTQQPTSTSISETTTTTDNNNITTTNSSQFNVTTTNTSSTIPVIENSTTSTAIITATPTSTTTSTSTTTTTTTTTTTIITEPTTTRSSSTTDDGATEIIRLFICSSELKKQMRVTSVVVSVIQDFSNKFQVSEKNTQIEITAYTPSSSSSSSGDNNNNNDNSNNQNNNNNEPHFPSSICPLENQVQISATILNLSPEYVNSMASFLNSTKSSTFLIETKKTLVALSSSSSSGNFQVLGAASGAAVTPAPSPGYLDRAQDYCSDNLVICVAPAASVGGIFLIVCILYMRRRKRQKRTAIETVRAADIQNAKFQSSWFMSNQGEQHQQGGGEQEHSFLDNSNNNENENDEVELRESRTITTTSSSPTNISSSAGAGVAGATSSSVVTRRRDTLLDDSDTSSDDLNLDMDEYLDSDLSVNNNNNNENANVSGNQQQQQQQNVPRFTDL